MLVEITGRGAHHSAHFADLDRLLPRFLQMADTHGHVDAFIGHVDHAVDQQGVDIHQGKAVQVIAQHWRHIQLAEQHRRGHRQVPTGDGITACRGFFSFIQFGEDTPTIFQVTLTGLGQVQAAGGACQQLSADALFHGGDGPGHARRRSVQAARSSGEALLLGHREKHLHFMKSVHRRSL